VGPAGDLQHPTGEKTIKILRFLYYLKFYQSNLFLTKIFFLFFFCFIETVFVKNDFYIAGGV